MTRSLFIALGIPLAIFSSCSKTPEEKPNIIFLLTDDQRWDALGAMGNDIIQTPNLDKLANEGVLFTNSYVTTSICCCSRASILTGQYVSRHKINSFQQDLTGEALQNTYPLLLKNKGGYKIGFIGKYGVGLEHRPDSLFDFWTCEKVGQPSYENTDENGEFLHYTDKVGNDIQTFLDEFEGNEPFCLSVSFKAPHVQDSDPRQFIYHPRYKDLYKDTKIPLPETAGDDYWNIFPEDFRTNNEARKRWEVRFPNTDKYEESVKGYYRLITGVDDVVGNMMKKLEDMEIAENTIIIFMGDNGFYLGEHGMAGKWYAHEESIRVPFFINDPRFPAGSKGLKLEQMALNIDIAPTILSIAGIDIPSEMQGQDVTKLITGDQEDIPWRTDFLYEHTIDIPTIPESYAVVSEQYKFISYPDLSSGFEEFYDREMDPFEKNNLINNPDYGTKIHLYKEKLDEMKKQAK